MGRGQSQSAGGSVLDRARDIFLSPREFEPIAVEPQTAHVATLHRISSKGVPARLELYTDIDDGIKSGWQVDLIEIHTDDGPAGYLKMSFIPQKNFDRLFADAFAWTVNNSNRYGHQMQQLLAKGESQWQRQDFLKALQETDGYRSDSPSIREQRQGADGKALAEAWSARRAEIAADNQTAYERFKDFHLDKPLVDFVRVYQLGDDRLYENSRRHQHRRAKQDHRSKGLAKLMYESGAMWMRSRQLELYASSTQSSEAAGIWECFENDGLVKTVGKRRILNTDALLQANSELADLLVS